MFGFDLIFWVDNDLAFIWHRVYFDFRILIKILFVKCDELASRTSKDLNFVLLPFPCAGDKILTKTKILTNKSIF